MSTRRPILISTAIAALALQPLAARAGLLEISDLFVFGDSLSDGGNSGLLTQAAAGVVFPDAPYAPGRYSNGLTAAEQLWNLYNADGGLQPSLAGGTNFAIGGATTGTANFNEVNDNVPAPLRPAFADFGTAWQLEQFAAHPAAGSFDPSTSLFVVWLVPNDIFYFDTTGMLPGVVPGSPGGDNVLANAIANIVTTIQILATAGAEHILVPNLVNLANTPAFAGGPLAEVLGQLTVAFNTGLAVQLAALDAAIAAEITLFDTDAVFQRLLDDPAAFGMTNTTDACVANLQNPENPCNPDTWLFWDGLHPTARTHEILAQQWRLALISEPGTLLLLGLGLLVLGLVRRR
jgi:phospholipase/lecithinase/hemolysin